NLGFCEATRGFTQRLLIFGVETVHGVSLLLVAGELGSVRDLAAVAIEEIDRDIVSRHAIGGADAARQRRGRGTSFRLAAAERMYLEKDPLPRSLRTHLAGMRVVAGSDRQEIKRDGVRIDTECRHQAVGDGPGEQSLAPGRCGWCENFNIGHRSR